MIAGKILIIDDDRGFAEVIGERLTREGYTVELADSAPAALSRLVDPVGWDVIILDIRLRGPEGPDDGLVLLPDVQERAPLAKIIVISGVADEKTVKPAFAMGAYDYVEKGKLFGALILIKVRNAMQATRERQLGAMDDANREHLLQQVYQDMRAERGRQKKGMLLEEVMLLIFKGIPGFEQVQPNVRGSAEELDLVVLNESRDPVWSKEGPFFIVECKNWSKPSEREDLDAFAGKLMRRGARCRLAFFVAVSGFSKGFLQVAHEYTAQGSLVVTLDGDALEALVLAGSRMQRNELLKGYYQRAALRAHTA